MRPADIDQLMIAASLGEAQLATVLSDFGVVKKIVLPRDTPFIEPPRVVSLLRRASDCAPPQRQHFPDMDVPRL